jgi:hypothetical protein
LGSMGAVIEDLDQRGIRTNVRHFSDRCGRSSRLLSHAPAMVRARPNQQDHCSVSSRLRLAGERVWSSRAPLKNPRTLAAKL